MIFDGALGSRGAALLKPYSDAPETSGYLTEKPEELKPMFEEALRRGIQVETHAIGDRANRTILDLYEQAFKAVPAGERKIQEPRWRVEHAQILSEQDLPRFAKLGVIASMQPSHAISVSCELRGQQLKSNFAVEPRVLRQIHVTHPARADLVDDAVMRNG